MLSSNLPVPQDPASSAVKDEPGAPPAAPAVVPVPRYTSPTWELEIFISGGVIFSLLQLPPLINGAFARLEPHATDGARFALLMGSVYIKSALYSLIAAFIIHLGARAYWGGLLGLHSVFPNGIRWDRMHVGPIVRDVYRERMPPLPKLIESIDNFASIIFSFAFLVVFIFGISIVGILFLVGLYSLAKATIGVGVFKAVMYSIGAVLIFAPIVIAIYDLKRGASLDSGSRAARTIRRIARFQYRTNLVGVSGPTLFTISSNTNSKATFAVFYLAVLGAMLLAIGEWVAREGVFTMAGTEYFSRRSEEHSMEYASYESQWPKDYVNRAAPSVQSDVIRDPYVRLFIPFQIRRHDAALKAKCPGIEPVQKRGLRLATSGLSGARADTASARILQCIADMHAVKVNGAATPNLRLRFMTHAETGIDGMVAYLPVTELPKGENVITVMPPPRSPTSRNKRPLQPYLIPFWL